MRVSWVADGISYKAKTLTASTDFMLGHREPLADNALTVTSFTNFIVCGTPSQQVLTNSLSQPDTSI